MAGYNAPVENPYNQNSKNQTPETLPMDEIIRRAITAALLSTRVMVPAKVTEILGNQKVNVQVSLKSRYLSGKVVSIPPIQNVLVSMLVGQDWSIKVPLAVGDTGMLIFCDRSLDIWSASDGGEVDPQDSRAHDISDPVFIPGLVPFSKQTQDSTTDMILTNGKAVIKIQKTGTFQVKNDSNELIDVLDQISQQVHTLSETLSTDTVNTIFGPTKLNAFSTYQNIATELQALIVKLETLKGS